MRVSGVDLKATRFNGIMMRVVHGDRTVFIEHGHPGYVVSHLVSLPNGTRHDRASFDDLNNANDLEEFLNYIALKLELQ